MARDLDIALLRTFAAVAERRSMAGASQHVHRTPGAVSQQVARLEGLVGTALFRRGPRGLRLTPAGERLLLRARALLALNDEIWSEIEAGAVAGPLRLGAPPDLVVTHLAPALKAFCDAFPRVDLTLVCLPSPALRSAIGDGRLDLAVMEEMLGMEDGETLGIDRLVWVGAVRGYAHRRAVLPVSIADEGCAFRPPVLSALARQGRASRPVLEGGGLDTTEAAVRMDLAVAPWLATTVPAGLVVLPGEAELPDLPPFAVTLHAAAAARGTAVEALKRQLRQAVAQSLLAA